MNRLLTFSLKNGFRRKGIAILAIAGSGIGTALMTVLLSLSSGMNTELNNTLNKVAGDIIISARGASVIGGFIGGGPPLPVKYSETIQTLDHVKFVSATVSAAIPKASLNSSSPIGTPLQGIVLDTNKPNNPNNFITDGTKLTNDTEAIVGKSLINQQRITGGTQLAIGQDITIPIMPVRLPGETIKPGGEAQTIKLKIVGTFETGNDINDRNVVTTIKTARKIAGLTDTQVSSIRVTADSTDNVGALTKAIEETFRNTDAPVQATASKDLLGDINKTLDIFRNFLLVIAVVAAVAGGVSIMIIMLMSVMERMQEFGILKAGGWSNNNILFSVFIESITLATSGAVIGFVSGISIGSVINKYMGQEIAVVTPLLTVGVLLFGVVMGVAGGLYPAFRAARVSPAETLKAL